MTAQRPFTLLHGATHKTGGTDALRLDELAAATASVALNNQRITGLGTPTATTDAATKTYVDSIASGLDVKASVRAATTANITLSGAQTIDGVSVVAGNRVLVKNQTTGANNGIYDCASGAWTRSTDADASGEVTAGMYTFVEEGSTLADQGWVLTTNNPITLGTTALAFTQFNSSAGAAKLDDALPPDDNTDLNASTSTHGLLPKLPGIRSKFLNGNGTYSFPHCVSIGNFTTTEWFINAAAPAGGDGLTPDAGFNTFASTMAVANDGDVVYLCSWLEENIVIDRRLNFIGLGNKPLLTHPPGQTAYTNYTIHVTAERVVIENIHLYCESTFRGVHLLLDRSGFFRGINLWIQGNPLTYGGPHPNSPGAGASPYSADGVGGIGILGHAHEMDYFENLYIQNTSIAIGIGTENTGGHVHRYQFSGNCQDVVQGLTTGPNNSAAMTTPPHPYGLPAPSPGFGHGGGWRFDKGKSTSPGGFDVNPIMDLFGDGTTHYAAGGANLFTHYDGSEGGGNTIRIGNARNKFEHCNFGGQTSVKVEGNKCSFKDCGTTGNTWHIDSDQGIYDGLLGTYAANFVGDGRWNTFRQCGINSIDMTGTQNTYEECEYWAAGAATMADLGSNPRVVNYGGICPQTYAGGGTVATDIATGNFFPVNVTNNTAFTFSNPIDMFNGNATPSPMTTEPITYDVKNSTGGVMGNISWGNKFALDATGFVKPANGKRKAITFYYNFTDDKWVQIGPTTGDI